MKLIATIFAFLIVAALTIAPAIYSGQRSFRWGEDEQVTRISNKLAAFPTEINGWQSESEVELGDTAENMLNPLAYVNRHYKKGDRFAQVFVLLGPTGPTAVHSPDICFSSSSYEQLANRQQVEVGDRSNLWRIRFKDRRTITGSPFLTSWYGWTTNQHVQADPNPRYTHSGDRFLLKVQITTQYIDRDKMFDDPEMERFVEAISAEIASAMSD